MTNYDEYFLTKLGLKVHSLGLNDLASQNLKAGNFAIFRTSGRGAGDEARGVGGNGTRGEGVM